MAPRPPVSAPNTDAVQGKRALEGHGSVAEHLGADTFLHLDVDGIGKMTARASGEFGAHHGDTVHLTPDKSRVHRFNEQGLAI